MKLLILDFLGLEDVNATDVSQILSYPNSGDYFFWAKIMVGLFFIVTLSLFFEEKARLGKGNMLSAAAIGSVSTITLSFIGSLFGVITAEVFTGILVFGSVLIFIWIIKKD